MTEDIYDILSIYTEKGSIAPDDRLAEDLGIDSLNMVRILMDVEDVFNIKLDVSDLNPYEFPMVSSVEELVKKYTDMS